MALKILLFLLESTWYPEKTFKRNSYEKKPALVNPSKKRPQVRKLLVVLVHLGFFLRALVL